ncbi:hypothetical protein ABPG75_001703 [Micractinium tetrahymenae]
MRAAPLRVFSAQPGPTMTPAAASDAHIQNARAYALPRVHEASRRRSLAPDPLLLSMFPPSEPEAARACGLCGGALSATLAAAEAGTARPAPGSRVQPSVDLPLAIRGVAVDKYVDDELLWLVHSIRKHRLRAGSGCERIQIVDLGCGFGTRPWRLPFSSNVAWLDVDLPAVLEEKTALLAAAGAEIHPPELHCDLRKQPAGAAGGGGGGSGGHGAGHGGGHGGAPAGAAQHPLRVGSYSPVVCHMLKGNLAEVLQAHGWDPAQPTIWVAFALIYYLDGRAVNLVMKSVQAASAAAPCSAFVGTIMNAGMVEMLQESVAAAAAGAQAEARAAGQEPPQPSTADITATVDPATSTDISDEMRRSSGVQAAATTIKFGVHRDVPTFLRGFGWESVEEVTPPDIDVMYSLYGVAMEYPQELRERMLAKHGHEPACVVGIGRRGF